ncbi:hypothetical protein BCL69_102417 [Nitrosomonas communis]|uniref:Uncharacterized protein n=1 Tax=Nitrosomonas communis TaxID=44574 RepID=A0A5D3YBZ8_9PROT|nr:hypothetical protein BCL69_102417 [Nitrosomonas communis]
MAVPNKAQNSTKLSENLHSVGLLQAYQPERLSHVDFTLIISYQTWILTRTALFLSPAKIASTAETTRFKPSPSVSARSNAMRLTRKVLNHGFWFMEIEPRCVTD